MTANEQNFQHDGQQHVSEDRAPIVRPRSAAARAAILAAVFAAGVAAAALVRSEDKQTAELPKIDAAALAAMVQNAERVEQEKHPWGSLRWLMSGKLDPKAEMTFGLVQVDAGQRNPMHIHPNCEEILYMLSGSCEHVLGDQTVTLNKGDLIRIPRGVPHYAKATGTAPMKAVIVYSSGDRQFVAVPQ